MNATDAELVGRSRKGDASAFAGLILRHERSLLALAYACTRCGATSADVVQDAVVRCWKRLDDLREESKFASWLATTVRHLATNAVRSPVRRMKLIGDEALDSNPVAPLPDTLEVAETRDLVAAAIGQLDEVSASIVTLRYFENLPSKQIGELLDLSPAAVDMRLSRARMVLKDVLAKDFSMSVPTGGNHAPRK